VKNENALILLKDGYRWNWQKKKLFHFKEEVVLTPREIKVLSLMISKAGQTVSSIDIYNYLYEEQPERDFSSDAITSLMKRLRQKLPKETLKSSYGVGYIFLIK